MVALVGLGEDCGLDQAGLVLEGGELHGFVVLGEDRLGRDQPAGQGDRRALGDQGL